MSSMAERIQGDLYGSFAGSMDDYKEIAEVAAAAALVQRKRGSQ